MSHDHSIQILFDSETIRVSRFACLCEVPHKPREEAAAGHEIVFPVKGYFERRNSHGKSHADPTRALFFNKGQAYEVDHPLGGGDVSIVFEIPEATLEGFSDDPGFQHNRLSGAPFQANHAPAGPGAWLDLYRILASLPRLTPRETLGSEETVLDFLRGVFEASPGAGQKPCRAVKSRTREAHAVLAERAVRYLNQNYDRPLKLAEVARAAFASPYHLCRVFGAYTGRTLHGYLSDLRIAAALGALRDGSPSLTGLALDLGYASHSHFSADFRKTLAMTPKAVRTLLAD